MTQLNDTTIDQPDSNNRPEQETVSLADSAADLVGILDGYLADLQAGKAPDRDQLLEEHPELAAELEACLAGIEFVHRATGPVAPEEPAALGEFRIVREIGRGGMGVVYEAEQTSLRRRVALKVLRYGAVADEEAMQRFHREAETVARLHHTNIVPIFAIGSERGVHYYAMQFIQGRSLADVLADSQRTSKPLPPADIARWGLQAAEALAHAHQRGVIHRDIKPSNLLLDTEDIVWLTDFGLAKCADEVTLTLCGMLMGTPRYMSPEQAESVRRPIDHRTDVYSLGASLFELATGRPVFDSTAPMGVIAQILTAEPERPRRIRPDLPRDLETIILTCLAKEPAQRYATAQALAEDLRAVRDGRPIRARRAHVLGIVVRYVRKRKKTLAAGTLVVAATMLLMVGALFGWRVYSDWRLGRVVLSTTGPALTTVVLPESGDEPIGEPFDLGTRTTLSLPSGDYRLRVQGVGLLGQTYRLAVHRGESRSYRLSLDENCLLGERPIPYLPAGESGDALMLKPGKADFIAWTAQALIRRDGATGEALWDAARSETPSAPGRDSFAWMQRLALVAINEGERRGTLVKPAPDLDGDGTGDVVMAFARTPSLLAISGRDGSMLWTYSAAVEGLGGPEPLGPDELEKALETAGSAGGGKPRPALKGGRVIGSPILVEVDGDGVLDLLVLFFVFDDPTGSAFTFGGDGSVTGFQIGQPGRRVIAGVSGRTGRAIWSRALDATTKSRPWLWNLIRPWSPPNLPFEGFDAGIALVPGHKGPIVAEVDGSKWTRLDPRTGRALGRPIDLDIPPVRPVQYADLDGDGEPELLALGEGSKKKLLNLAAFSTTTGDRLWSEPVAGFDAPARNATESAAWPLVGDLDGDGRAEVVVPDSGILPQCNDYRGVRLLDGATGQARWARPMRPDAGWADGLAHLIAGPDLDGDGTRDLVAVSRYFGRSPGTYSVAGPVDRTRFYVDALSGKDGRPLWCWHKDVTDYSEPRLWPPIWWGRGPDVWPMLVVPLGGKVPGEDPLSHLMPPVVHLLEASTGRTLHTIDGLFWPRLADLDGDGLEDLWGSVDGKLRAFRAGPPEAWRSLDALVPAADLDGDGIADAMTAELRISADFEKPRTDSRTAVARSGRDGRMLWTKKLDEAESLLNWEAWLGPQMGVRTTLSTFPLPTGDLDGDGAPEVVVVKREDSGRGDARGAAILPIQVLSGRSGRWLWSAGPLPALGPVAFGYAHVDGVDVRTDDATGIADLLVVHDTRLARVSSMASGSYPPQTHLTRLSGRDGRVVWDILLAEHTAGLAKHMGFDHQYGDLDGDGSLDVVLRTFATPATGPTPLELRAVSFRDGKTLWAHPIRDQSAAYVVGDVDGDGRAEVIVGDRPPEGTPPVTEVTALDGREGAIRWISRCGDVRDPSMKGAMLYLVDFDGKGRREVCLDLGKQVVILDAHGQNRVSREPAGKIVACTDLDGDGRDELLLQDVDRLYASRGNLAEMWSRPSRELVNQVIPAQAGRPATVVLGSMVALDGATGRTRWKGGPSRVLDPGSAEQSPRLLTTDDDATICSRVLPTTPEGAYEPARGMPAPLGLTSGDPRWARPLPWSTGGGGLIPLLVFLGMAGLATINVVIPLSIVKLATRRRVWGVRLLLALPAVVAIPLAVFLTVLSVTPSMAGATAPQVITGFSLATLGGLPIVVYVALIGSSLLRRRWWRLVMIAVLSVLVTVGLAAYWLWVDRRWMATIEHYTWSGWHTVIVPGLYLVGGLAMVTWAVRGTARFVWKRWRRRRAIAMNPS
jgi:outer membrane protein assembly factor BamB/tRNA A-37 threonylcarbamoyl transferase component Bud32